MRNGAIRDILKSHVQECGSNTEMAYEHAADQVGRLLNEGKVKAQDFSIGMMFHELVDTGGQYLGTMSVDAISEAVSASAFPYITEKIVSDTLIKAYNTNVGEVGNLVTEEDATGPRDSDIAGIEAGEGFEMVGESMDYEETELSEKAAKVRIGKFGRIIGLTREMILFDRTGQLLTRAKGVGEKGGLHRAKMIVQTLEMEPRTAFREDSDYLRAAVFDGTIVKQDVFYMTSTHAAYEYLHGQSNINDVAAVLSNVSLEDAYNLLSTMTDEVGDPITVNVVDLVIHPLDSVTAWQITKQIGDYQNANNAGAPFGPGGVVALKVTPTIHIETGTRNWYIGDCKSQLRWHWAIKPETSVQTRNSESAFKRDIFTQYKFMYMGGCAHTDIVHVVRGGA